MHQAIYVGVGTIAAVILLVLLTYFSTNAANSQPTAEQLEDRPEYQGETAAPAPTLGLSAPLPPPSPTAPGPAIWGLVITDMHTRDRFGLSKYHTRLHAHDGRDPLTDAYQEALDLAVYLRKAIYERDDLHGDSIEHPGTASDGCIIPKGDAGKTDRQAREAIFELSKSDPFLRVQAQP